LGVDDEDDGRVLVSRDGPRESGGTFRCPRWNGTLGALGARLVRLESAFVLDSPVVFDEALEDDLAAVDFDLLFLLSMIRPVVGNIYPYIPEIIYVWIYIQGIRTITVPLEASEWNMNSRDDAGIQGKYRYLSRCVRCLKLDIHCFLSFIYLKRI